MKSQSFPLFGTTTVIPVKQEIIKRPVHNDVFFDIFGRKINSNKNSSVIVGKENSKLYIPSFSR
jgi:hypothetical protein